MCAAGIDMTFPPARDSEDSAISRAADAKRSPDDLDIRPTTPSSVIARPLLRAPLATVPFA